MQQIFTNNTAKMFAALKLGGQTNRPADLYDGVRAPIVRFIARKEQK